MLHPRNPWVSSLLYLSYGWATLHGVAIIFTPPTSIVPVIGELNLVWGVAAIVGSIIASFGYSRGAAGRLLEAFGMALMAYAFTTYAASAISALITEGDPANRFTQITALGSLVSLTWARSATLLVLWYRDRRKLRALANAVKSFHGKQ